MSPIRRAMLLKWANQARELDVDVKSGVLEQDEETGRWRIGGIDLVQWLTRYEGQELVMLTGTLNDEREVVVRTCRTCGRDYQDSECPHCRASRLRLRGY